MVKCVPGLSVEELLPATDSGRGPRLIRAPETNWLWLRPPGISDTRGRQSEIGGVAHAPGTITETHRARPRPEHDRAGHAPADPRLPAARRGRLCPRPQRAAAPGEWHPPGRVEAASRSICA